MAFMERVSDPLSAVSLLTVWKDLDFLEDRVLELDPGPPSGCSASRNLDNRSMLDRRSAITERYTEAAKRDPWTPPCSFCGENPTVAWFEGPHFRVSVDAADKVRADEAWTACDRCFQLIQADDHEGLARRGTRRLGDRVEPERALAMTLELQDKFWAARSTG